MQALLDRELTELPDPERALVQFDRFLASSFNPTGILEDLLRDKDMLRRFFRLVSASQWLADTIVRDAGLFRWLLATDVLQTQPTRAAINDLAGEVLHRFPPGKQRSNALRRLQRQELLRIAAADVLGLKDMDSVLRELSALADAMVAGAWEEACALFAQRYGKDPNVVVCILALGKLGGQELNYSSDIDLMFVFEDGDDDAGQRMVALVKETVRILTEVTSEGMLYRTDLRLRPDGSAGALALSLTATLTYYETRGALWERQMLLRARPCAGDPVFGTAVMKALAPFVYPRTTGQLPSQLISDVRERLAERYSLNDNVKHMHGGIRQIEFSLQVLQLLHAPRAPELRTPSTMQSIDALASASLLSLEEEALLRDAYLFLRRVEHALQLESFEQTHSLPADIDGLLRVAWLLRFASTDVFLQRLDRTRKAVRQICDGLLVPKSAQHDVVGLPDSFRHPVRTRQIMHDLVEGRGSRPHSGSERARLQRLRPVLIDEISRESLPDHTIASLENFLHRASSPAAVIALLEQDASRHLLLRLACTAPVVLRHLETDPLALELVFTGYDARGLDNARLRRVRDTAALGGLMLGDIDLSRCSEILTDTADMILRRVLKASEASETRLSVLALGKYGGQELLPGSDLDVIFLFDARDTDDQQRAQKQAADVIASMQGSGVRMYEVDARLRPEGASAPLAVSRDSWLRYHDGRASLWELQSLLRARVVGATDESRQVLETDIRRLLSAFTLTPAHVEEVRQMRARMEPQNRFRQEEYFDIKRSPGGLVDCEFAVQLLALAARMPEAGNNAKAFAQLASRFDELSAELKRMHAWYQTLRSMQLVFRTLLDVPGNLFPTEDSARHAVAAVMKRRDGPALLEELSAGMQQNRRDFTAVCETLISLHDRHAG
jgi:glutamate-ammonia-ligase adenylyltransferase